MASSYLCCSHDRQEKSTSSSYSALCVLGKNQLSTIHCTDWRTLFMQSAAQVKLYRGTCCILKIHFFSKLMAWNIFLLRTQCPKKGKRKHNVLCADQVPRQSRKATNEHIVWSVWLNIVTNRIILTSLCSYLGPGRKYSARRRTRQIPATEEDIPASHLSLVL